MREPLEIHITMRNDEYVKELEGRCRELERQLVEMRTQRDQVEYRYRCESLINTELTDLLREHGIKYRAALVRRPWSGE